MTFNSTIARKKKQCKGCPKVTYIYARDNCLECDRKENPTKHGIQPKGETQKKRKRINPVSDKKATELKKYRLLRDLYMENHSICEFKECSKPSNDLHHKKPRKTHLCDVTVFMSVCRNHHDWIHNNHAKAVELGYLYQAIRK